MKKHLNIIDKKATHPFLSQFFRVGGSMAEMKILLSFIFYHLNISRLWQEIKFQHCLKLRQEADPVQWEISIDTKKGAMVLLRK